MELAAPLAGHNRFPDSVRLQVPLYPKCSLSSHFLAFVHVLPAGTSLPIKTLPYLQGSSEGQSFTKHLLILVSLLSSNTWQALEKDVHIV